MSMDPHHLPAEVLGFLAERHLATLTTLRADGSPHVVPVGFGFDPHDATVRIITFASSRKVLNLSAPGPHRAVVCQVDGGRWLSLEGPAGVTEDPQRIAGAVAAYRARYREPSERTDRVAIEIHVDRVSGRA